MISRTLILFLVLFNFISFGYAQNFARSYESIKAAEIPLPLPGPILGERLVYKLEWLGIPVGTLSLEVQEKTSIDGNDCFHIVGKISSSRLFSKIRKVNYRVDSYINSDDFYTHRFRKRRWMDDDFSDLEIDFSRSAKKASYQDKVSGAIIPLELKEDMHDLLSSLYYFRLMEIKLEESYDLKIVYGTQFWNARIKVSEIEPLEIYRMGRFETFRSNIDTGLGEVILGKRKLTVFFTLDSRRIPLRFLVHSPLGPLRGQIISLPN